MRVCNFNVAALKLRRALGLKYRPDQPRVPAGQLGGGQWTDEDGSGGGSATTGLARVAQLDPSKGYAVNLKEEDARGGHAIERHVGKSDEYMLKEARRERPAGFGVSINTYRHGSFASLEDANDLTNRTLEQNQEAVGEFVKARFGFPTGREAVRLRQPRAEPYMRTTYGVGVDIRHDPQSRRGFRVHTAYPRND